MKRNGTRKRKNQSDVVNVNDQVPKTKRDRTVYLRSNDKGKGVRVNAHRVTGNALLQRKKKDEHVVVSDNRENENGKKRSLAEKLGITRFGDLDEAIQNECIEHNIPECLVEEHMDVMLLAADFLMSKDLKYRVKRGGIEFNSPDVTQNAQWQIKIPTKPIKKLFKKKTLLGVGAFGEVWMGKDKKTQQYVAMKILKNETQKEKDFNLIEIGILMMVQHKNLLELYESFHVGRDLWIITEYIKGGPLSGASDHRFQEIHIAFIAKEILCGLSYLHNLNIAHRDIKPSNIMLARGNSVKLVDFGLACDFHDGPKRKICGSPFWISPEMTKNQSYTTKIDIWSLGVVILELFLVERPYEKSPLQSIFMGAVTGFSEFLSDDRISNRGKRFLTDCMQLNPDDRPSANRLSQKSFVNRDNLDHKFDEVVGVTFFTQSLAVLGF